jgi:hypothetical protein
MAYHPFGSMKNKIKRKTKRINKMQRAVCALSNAPEGVISWSLLPNFRTCSIDS